MPSSVLNATDSKAKPGIRLAKWLLFRVLNQLQGCQLNISDPEGEYSFGSIAADDNNPLIANITIKHLRCYKAMAFDGTIGSSEAYVIGDWEADNLTNVIRIMARNAKVMDKMEGVWSFLAKPVLRIAHFLNKNSELGSKKNIIAHYDLGNDLFEYFLDPTMMYSAAVFPHKNASLEQASITKLELICKKLQLKPEDHLLEIGTGWGSMAIHAAKHYGCQVTTTTISEEQYDLAEQRIKAEGLENKITLLKQDYRLLQGQYDKLVTVEMIEAVGWQYYDEFFACCSRLLKPDGLMLMQAITIDERRYEQAKTSVDFIQKYIFPGSCIPSVSALNNAVINKTDMRLTNLEDITSHYATTLRMWSEQMHHHSQSLTESGYDQQFQRLWQFYFSYCEGGFAERSIGDVHLVFSKPEHLEEPLPSLQRYL